MATITRQGTLELRTKNEGSKSEGHYAILLTDEGAEFTLYRAGNMPMDDPFFAPYDGRIVEAGNHNELIAAEGVYYGLYMSQFAGIET